MFNFLKSLREKEKDTLSLNQNKEEYQAGGFAERITDFLLRLHYVFIILLF